MKSIKNLLFLFLIISLELSAATEQRSQDFNRNWKFALADSTLNASAPAFDDSGWRTLNLPHDWSIESDFGKDFPASPGGGALPGGIGWYRKSFSLEKPKVLKPKRLFIEFDGVYRNSEVWINGSYLGKRPNGYISFSYDITPYIHFGGNNVVAVKVDNSKQPNSRWYSGSGIYRNVRLVSTNPVFVDNNGTYVTTPHITADSAEVSIQTTVRNTMKMAQSVGVEQTIYDAAGNVVAKTKGSLMVNTGGANQYYQKLMVPKPVLWNLENPYLYKLVTKLDVFGIQNDLYETSLGIRSLNFDVQKGFFLNGKPVKINGVCNHHDLGALGAAVNTRALERQLEIMKNMGVNAIRTSHNPPAPELLDLCDRMGLLVMDEAFDIWKKKKSKYDYSADFDQWHERDLKDQITRDRNHPSVFIWSIGNEVGEQWGDTPAEDVDLQTANIALNNKKVNETEDVKLGQSGKNALLTRHLADIAKSLDPARPVTAACNGTQDNNPLFKSGALDLIGFNYHEKEFAGITSRYPKTPFIVTESVSALQTRGFYMMPSDSMFLWPESWDKPFDRPVHECSAYDNCHAPWGSTHEETWRIVKKHPHVSGQFIWTGFDYLGEPTPFWWPSRSSFFGIVDLAGFPKDVYYMYQSEWADKDVLHVFPHWNWTKGQTVDVWAYYNHADEVELFLNGVSLGKRTKQGDDLHVMWRVPYEPGTLKAVSRKNGKEVLVRETMTAGEPASIRLTPDRPAIKADGNDLSFVTVELLDKDGNVCPLANRLVKFTIEGEGSIAGTDNGDQNDHVSLKKPERHLFYGKCLAIVQSGSTPGAITLKASVEGLPVQAVKIVKK
ncbi:MAG TPA: glycoside hydrolase family 2 TIM barrel-domain containing protein [Paludibacter sp.]|nr:glycoside hydrolase family 2 TIM barrel-domain containing protein [Paludibacter sp.]